MKIQTYSKEVMVYCTEPVVKEQREQKGHGQKSPIVVNLFQSNYR